MFSDKGIVAHRPFILVIKENKQIYNVSLSIVFSNKALFRNEERLIVFFSSNFINKILRAKPFLIKMRNTQGGISLLKICVAWCILNNNNAALSSHKYLLKPRYLEQNFF